MRRKIKEFSSTTTPVYKPPTIKDPNKPVEKSKEGKVVTYNCEQLKDSFLQRAIAVNGVIDSIHIVDNDPDTIHAYINFRVAGTQKVSILISNNKYKQFEDTSKIVSELREQWKTKSKNKELNCICFGWIQPKNEGKGYNVIPLTLSAIQIYTSK